MTRHNPLYIIPARGGSKGIPRKNIVDLCGYPLIAWTLNAIPADVPRENIIISTDDDEIADVVASLGFQIPYRRPKALATDTAGSREVIIDAMDYADRVGIKYDCVVLLQPTSPLRLTEDINRAIALYSDDIDMVVSVSECSANPYYNCFETDVNGYLHVAKGDGLITQRQDAPKAWEFNGAVYVINPSSIRAMTLGAMPRRLPSPMPRERSVDIDTPLDLAIAQAIIQANETVYNITR